jgi:hypothetical protein
MSLYVLVAVLAVGAAFPPAGALGRQRSRPTGTPVPNGFVGVNGGGPLFGPAVNLGQQLDLMVASGVESVRVLFSWSQAQPYRSWADVPSDQKNEFVDVDGVPTSFAGTDQIVGLAAERRLRLLPVVVFAPPWDSARNPTGGHPPPARVAPFGHYLTALVDRYGPHGSYWRGHGPKLPVRMWQIWNEPNILAFWPKQPYYSRYVALLRAAHAAIKRADPTAKVVLAGLPNFSWFELARLYEFRGARSLFDVVAVHPYTRTPQGVITILGYVRAAMNQAGDRSKPIIADEISWPSSVGHTRHTTGFDFATTESGQARNIGKLLPMLVRDRARLGLAGFYYYDWVGLERANALAFDFAGLFRFGAGKFVAKPAFGVFRRDALAMEGCRTKGPLAQDCQRP